MPEANVLFSYCFSSNCLFIFRIDNDMAKNVNSLGGIVGNNYSQLWTHHLPTLPPSHPCSGWI